MSNNLVEYIHKNDYYEHICVALEEAEQEITLAIYDRNDKERKNRQSYVYENADIVYLTEEANKGFFASIGSAIMKLVAKIQEFFGTVINKIQGFFNGKQSALNDAKKLATENPELAKQMIAEINSGRDLNEIKRFNSEALALINAYKSSGKIMSDEDFESKFDKIYNNADSKAKSAGKVVKSISGVLELFQNTIKIVKNAKDVNMTLSSALESYKKEIDNQKNYQNGSKPRAIIAAFKKMIGLNTAAYHEKVLLSEKLANIIEKIAKNNKLSQKLNSNAASKKQNSRDIADKEDARKAKEKEVENERNRKEYIEKEAQKRVNNIEIRNRTREILNSRNGNNNQEK